MTLEKSEKCIAISGTSKENLIFYPIYKKLMPIKLAVFTASLRAVWVLHDVNLPLQIFSSMQKFLALLYHFFMYISQT
jgi:hypothetical protein